LGQALDLSEKTAATGFEYAALGIGEARNVEGRQFFERPLGLFEAGLDLTGG
jgi:hypothetical protein